MTALIYKVLVVLNSLDLASLYSFSIPLALYMVTVSLDNKTDFIASLTFLGVSVTFLGQ